MSSPNASVEYDRSSPVVVVSNDTHIGPRLVEDLRDYCPARHLDDFDRFAVSTAGNKADAAALLGGSGYLDRALGVLRRQARPTDEQDADRPGATSPE
jgi:hypothetical protein